MSDHPIISSAESDFAKRILRRLGLGANADDGLDVVTWIERHFFIPERLSETPPAMPLAPYQRAVLREACRTDGNGKFVYDTVVWSDIKKSAKSSIAGAVALYRAIHTPYGSFKIVANDLKQADSRVFYYIRRAIELNPDLSSRATIRNYKISLVNKAEIEAVPVDPSGEAGGNDDFIEFTELHAASSKASQRMWSEMTIPPTKYGRAQRWIDTYAGHNGESPILEQLYDECVRPEKGLTLVDPEAPDDLELYRSGSILCLWNTKPRMAWQTADYYESEAKVLPPVEFERMHRNQWGRSQNVFVSAEWWAGCKADELPQFNDRDPLIIGVDAGVSNDCFALVGVTRKDDLIYVRYVRIFTPPPQGTLDFSEPETVLRALAAAYNVIEFAYDPYQLHDMATRLKRDGLRFRAFDQGQDRLLADKQLYDAIRDRRIVHGGQRDLTAHIENANAETNGERMRIVKRATNLKIDAAVALSMAHARAFALRSLTVGRSGKG